MKKKRKAKEASIPWNGKSPGHIGKLKKYIQVHNSVISFYRKVMIYLYNCLYLLRETLEGYTIA